MRLHSKQNKKYWCNFVVVNKIKVVWHTARTCLNKHAHTARERDRSKSKLLHVVIMKFRFLTDCYLSVEKITTVHHSECYGWIQMQCVNDMWSFTFAIAHTQRRGNGQCDARCRHRYESLTHASFKQEIRFSVQRSQTSEEQRRFKRDNRQKWNKIVFKT